jgi:DNA-binding SARP family transcriptional activator/Flp pilus assembly protein TadD
MHVEVLLRSCRTGLDEGRAVQENGMWFAILGPLLVHDGEMQVNVPKGRQRVLLAALLVHAGEPVSADSLAEVVWDGAPSSGAEVTLRSHVLRLRRALGPYAGARLVTRHPGYLLQASEDEADVLRFRRLCQDGGTALRERAWWRADGLLGEALNLWRGTPLADIPSESLHRDQVQGLEELRLQAEEWRTDAALHLGRHAELVPRLQSLAAGHPLRERFHSQLMLALYRCGRQAEALAVYQRARDVLVGELGVEPGPGLRDLHQRILSADADLDITSPVRSAEAGPQRAVPRELPPAVPGFTGRSDELSALSRLLDRPDEQAPGAVVISAIGGTAGVGKTALAVQWAHQATGSFPDGQLYVNLRGYDPGQPMPATDALAGFLRSLGVAGSEIPPDEEERTARYRSLLAGKRLLVVLDNAGSADQIRPLLPGTRACAVVVTSRGTLAGLVARDGAARLNLGVLPQQDAVALLRTLIGARVDAEPEASAELADQCCRLPLALRVAAEFAASHPAATLAGLADELTDLRTRLDRLAADGDPRTQVRTVFSWSYRHLDADAARTFRLLGLHPGPDLDPYAAAALTDTAMPQATRALDVLSRAHLIQPAAPGRYGMHDLLRAYARELTADLDTSQEQHAALTRLFDHYLHTAMTAMDAQFPTDHHRRPLIPRPTTPVPPLTDPAAAREWLDAERTVLVAAAGHTAAHGWTGHATRLAATLASYLHSGDCIPEALTIYGHALGAARGSGDHAAEATALKNIGNVELQQSRLEQAGDHHRQALALFREIGDRSGEARTLGSIGLGETSLGRYEQAGRHQQEAVAIFRDIGDRVGESRALGNLGLVRQREGRYQEAADHHKQSLDLSREFGDGQGEAWALARLGFVDLRLGRLQHAAGYLQQAIAMFHEMGSTSGVAENLVRLGDVYVELGRYEQAAGNFEQALAMFREIGDPIMESDALNGLGEVLFRTGDLDQARAHHATALRRASEVSAPRHQARAHSGLARVYQACGDSLRTRHHWQEALTRYEAIGSPEADEIHARLDKASDSDDDQPGLCPGRPSRSCWVVAIAAPGHDYARWLLGGGPG